MPSDAPAPQKPARPFLSNAPVVVIIMAGVLVLCHWASTSVPLEQQVQLRYDHALVPRRFFANDASIDAYADWFEQLLTLASTALLHGDWIHVLVNTAMLLSFGIPIARAFGNDISGIARWLGVFWGSVIVGSIAYLFAVGVDGGAAVGASGGTSGLIAAAFLIDPGPRLGSVTAQRFVSASIVFALINVALVLLGPSLLGMQIAWEAHAGGWVAGALLMLLLAPPRLKDPAFVTESTPQSGPPHSGEEPPPLRRDPT